MDLEKQSIERIKMASEMSLHYYGKPLVCTYSGGKDSDVMLELFKRSGVPFEVHNNHTTADAPETVRHIRKKFKTLANQGIKAEIEYPKETMWQIIPKKLMPPTRRVRYCCEILKEGGCNDRFIATGVRWDESIKRTERKAYESLGRTKKQAIRLSDEMMLMNDNSDKRQFIEKCELKASMVVNPIIDWTHQNIWEYIHSEKIDVNYLYQCGYERVGCIGCPLATPKKRYKEFTDFPKYKQMYLHAFDRMIEARKARGLDCKWKNAEEVFLWWMEDQNVEGQMSIFDFPEVLP